MDISEEKSLYFEDFEIGKVFSSSFREVTANDIEAFADLSGDHNPIHVKKEIAEKSIYGQRIAHGLLILSLVSGLAVGMGIAERTTIAFRSLEWKFKQPVAIGDAIKAVFVVSGRKYLANLQGGLVRFDVKVKNQVDQLVQIGKWALVIKSHGPRQ
jgi:acyl dehydratase